MRRYGRRRPKPTTDARPPEQRLEALVREPNPERASRTLERILDDLDAAPQPAPWISAARTLSERLIVSDDTFYYFVELFTECLIAHAASDDTELCRLSEDMIAIERANGLRADQSYTVGQGPSEWESANDAWERRAFAIVASYLREHGHADVATLVAEKPEEFERRAAKGQTDLWGDDDSDER